MASLKQRLPRMLRLRLLAGRPYFIVFLISSFIVSRWFIPGTFIATGDMGPWIRQGWAPEATSSWNHTVSGAGSAAFTVARSFELILIRITSIFGGDEYVAQWLFYTLIYGLVAVGVAYAARGIVRNEAAVVAAGTFAVLNGFFLTRLPNPLNIISVGSIALLTGLAIRVARGRKIGAPWAGIALLPTSFLAFNPPMIVVAYAWALAGLPVLIYFMMGWAAMKRLLLWMLAAAPWAVLLNLWWVIPFAFSYLSGGGAVANTNFTDPTAWAWSQAQNSIQNVFTLVANWAWVKPQYLPFASAMDEPWIIWMRYLIPVLVLFTPFFALRYLRRTAIVLVGASLLFVFLAKGLQPPFAQVNLFLYEHVPGFWLFREPMSKLGQLLVIFFAILFAILLESVTERFRLAPTVKNRSLQVVAWVSVLIVILQVYPLWTGSVIPDARPSQPSAHVRVPQYWHDMADYLNADERDGKVLIMPLDDYYQMPTTWGFTGVDSIANLLITHPVVQPKPDGYFGDTPGYSALTHGIETALLSGDLEAVPRLLAASGISRIVVRHDLVRGLPGRKFADDQVISAALERTPQMSLIRQGELDLWYLNDGSLPTVHSFNTVLDAPARPSAGASVLGTVPSDTAILTRKTDPTVSDPLRDTGSAVMTDDVVQWPVPAVDSGAPSTVISTTGGEYTLAQRSRAAPSFIPSILSPAEGKPSLILHDPTAVTIDGVEKSRRADINIPLPTDDVIAVTAGSRTVSLDTWGRDMLPSSSSAAPRPSYLPIGSATPVTVWASSSTPAAPLPPSKVYDCNNYEPRPFRELGLRLNTIPSSQGETLRLSAEDHAACTQITVPDAAPGRTYRVRMMMRTVEGKRPEVCLYQIGTVGCDLVPRSPISTDWIPFEQFVTMDEISTGLQIVMYANVGVRHELKTVTEYRDISIDAVDPALRTTVFPTEIPSVTVNLPAGEHTLALTGGQSGTVLQDFGPLENCYNTRQMTNEEAGLTKAPLPSETQPAFQLTAQHDRACIAAPVPDMGAASLYELSYDGRSISLRNPVVCLYQRGPDRCTTLPAGGPWKTWTSYRAFVTPDPKAVETRLYLFGSRDLAGQRKATVQYRAVKLRPVAAPVDVVLIRQTIPATPAVVTFSQESPVRFPVDFSHATPPSESNTGTYLALNEAYAPGWAAQASTGVDSTQHLKLQGWLNAWPVTSSDGDATFVYAPDRYAQIALKLFPVVLLLALAWLIIRRPTRRIIREVWAVKRYQRKQRKATL